MRRTVRFVGTVVGRPHGAGADLMGVHLSRMHRVDEVVVVVLVVLVVVKVVVTVVVVVGVVVRVVVPEEVKLVVLVTDVGEVVAEVVRLLVSDVVYVVVGVVISHDANVPSKYESIAADSAVIVVLQVRSSPRNPPILQAAPPVTVPRLCSLISPLIADTV